MLGLPQRHSCRASPPPAAASRSATGRGHRGRAHCSFREQGWGGWEGVCRTVGGATGRGPEVLEELVPTGHRRSAHTARPLLTGCTPRCARRRHSRRQRLVPGVGERVAACGRARGLLSVAAGKSPTSPRGCGERTGSVALALQHHFLAQTRHSVVSPRSTESHVGTGCPAVRMRAKAHTLPLRRKVATASAS